MDDAAHSRRALDRVSRDIDDLNAGILQAGDHVQAQRALLGDRQPSDQVLIAVLRRAVPRAFLEAVASTEPWNQRSMVLGAVVLSPRIAHGLAMRVLPQLPWRALAQVSATPRLAGPVRQRAETILKDLLPDLKLGERIALARLVAPAILRPLLMDAESQVVQAALANPRLREDDVLYALGRETSSRALLEEVASAWRWRDSYAVRLALVVHPRTPLSLSLVRLTGLVERDLRRVMMTQGLVPLVRAAARRVLEDRARERGMIGTAEEPSEGIPDDDAPTES